MSQRETVQMNLDAESAAHTGMGGQSRSTQKYLLLQVWCGLLTVAMVAMAAFLMSIKPKSPEDGVPTSRPEHVGPTDNTLAAPLKSVGSSFSCIQLIKSVQGHSWQNSPERNSSFLSRHNDTIHCTRDGLYFIYAQVTFTKRPKSTQSKSVIVKRDARVGKMMKKLVEGTFPNTTEGSVWVAKIVSLQAGDSVSLDISDECLNDSTFFGACHLH